MEGKDIANDDASYVFGVIWVTVNLDHKGLKVFIYNLHV